MHKLIASRYRSQLRNTAFRFSVVTSFVVFAMSLVVNNLAIQFSSEKVSNSVTDLILSNTQALPVDNLFVWGTFALIFVSIVLCLADPKRIPFALYTTALFFIIRSVFTSLTHLAPFAPHLADDFGTTVNRAFFGGDLFFSGHTGFPFLGALAFWNEIPARYFYLASSVFFATIVLLGHIHYSIDVASAFFITYGIYHIALWLFPGARALFVTNK